MRRCYHSAQSWGAQGTIEHPQLHTSCSIYDCLRGLYKDSAETKFSLQTQTCLLHPALCKTTYGETPQYPTTALRKKQWPRDSHLSRGFLTLMSNSSSQVAHSLWNTMRNKKFHFTLEKTSFQGHSARAWERHASWTQRAGFKLRVARSVGRQGTWNLCTNTALLGPV